MMADSTSTEVCFLKLYRKVIEKEIESSQKNTSLLRVNKECLAKVINMPESNASSLQFDSPEVRCAYIFQYGACLSSSAAYHFRKFLENDLELFQKLVSEDNLNICCLGGGPAAEFVTVVKTLELLMVNFNFKQKTPLHITAIVVDIKPTWRMTAENMIESLSKTIDSSKMTFSLSFIEDNLTMPFGPDLQSALLKSDIVTTKFLSAHHGAEDRWKDPEVLKGIINGMHDDRILFFMDSSVEHFSLFRDAVRSFECMTEIYRPLDYDEYKMSPLSKDECLTLYSKYYGNKYCAEKIKNHVSIWYKKKYPNAEKVNTEPREQPGTCIQKSSRQKRKSPISKKRHPVKIICKHPGIQKVFRTLKRKSLISSPSLSSKIKDKQPGCDIENPSHLKQKTLLPPSPKPLKKTEHITLPNSKETDEGGIKNLSPPKQKFLLPSPDTSENPCITVSHSSDVKEVHSCNKQPMVTTQIKKQKRSKKTAHKQSKVSTEVGGIDEKKADESVPKNKKEKNKNKRRKLRKRATRVVKGYKSDAGGFQNPIFVNKSILGSYGGNEALFDCNPHQTSGPNRTLLKEPFLNYSQQPSFGNNQTLVYYNQQPVFRSITAMSDSKETDEGGKNPSPQKRKTLLPLPDPFEDTAHITLSGSLEAEEEIQIPSFQKRKTLLPSPITLTKCMDKQPVTGIENPSLWKRKTLLPSPKPLEKAGRITVPDSEVDEGVFENASLQKRKTLLPSPEAEEDDFQNPYLQIRKSLLPLPEPFENTVHMSNLQEMEEDSIKNPSLQQRKTLLPPPNPSENTVHITVSNLSEAEEDGIQNLYLQKRKSLLPLPKPLENTVYITLPDSEEAEENDIKNPYHQKRKTLLPLPGSLENIVHNSQETDEGVIENASLQKRKTLLPAPNPSENTVHLSNSPETEEDGIQNPYLLKRKTLLPLPGPRENTMHITVPNVQETDEDIIKNPSLQKRKTLLPLPDPSGNTVHITVSNSPKAEDDSIQNPFLQNRKTLLPFPKPFANTVPNSQETEEDDGLKSPSHQKRKILLLSPNPSENPHITVPHSPKTKVRTLILRHNTQPSVTTKIKKQKRNKKKSHKKSKVSTEVGDTDTKKADESALKNEKHDLPVNTVVLKNKNKKRKSRKRSARVVKDHKPEAGGIQNEIFVPKSNLGAYGRNETLLDYSQQQTFKANRTLLSSYDQPVFGTSHALLDQQPLIRNDQPFLSYSQESSFRNNHTLLNYSEQPIFRTNPALLTCNEQPVFGINRAHCNYSQENVYDTNTWPIYR